MQWLDFNIKSWSDINAIVAILSLPLIAISLIAAFQQVKNQAEISRKDLTFNGLISFSDKYQRISDYLQSMRERFEAGDKTLNIRTVRSYFHKYWLHTAQQWDFFEAGLVPYETFLGWTCFAYSHMAGETNIFYFGKEGEIQTLNSRIVFQEDLIDSVYKYHTKLYNFYVGLFNLCANKYSGKPIPKDRRIEEISKYIVSYSKKTT